MAIFKPTVTRRRSDGTKYTEKSGVWWGRFRHPATDKWVSVSLKTRDSVAARTNLKMAERRAAKIANGDIREADERPLEKHIDDYEQSLADRGKTPGYINTAVPRVRAVAKHCGFVYWKDIDQTRLESFLADLRDVGMPGATKPSPLGIRTRNFYGKALKAFCLWMIERGRADRDPLIRMKSQTVTDEDKRRAFEPEQFIHLIETVRNNGPIQAVPGPERAMLYLVAAMTGYRFSECRSLRWGLIDLESDRPTATVQAGARGNKKKRQAVQPLSDDTVTALKAWRSTLGDVGPDDAVFPNLREWHIGAKMLRRDLTAAEIPFRDDADRKLVFHSLRDTYLTMIGKATDGRTTQELARHTDPRLTSKYRTAFVDDQFAAVNRLPKLAEKFVAVYVAHATCIQVQRRAS